MKKKPQQNNEVTIKHFDHTRTAQYKRKKKTTATASEISVKQKKKIYRWMQRKMLEKKNYRQYFYKM